MSDVNQAFNDFIVEHNDELIKGFNAGKSVHDTIADIDIPARS